MVKGARQREWPRHLSTHTHTHWTLPTTMSVLETPFDIHVSSVYQTHTCMQAPIPTLCISAKKTHNKGSRTRPIMSTLMPRSGIPVICSRATLSCDSSYWQMQKSGFLMMPLCFGKLNGNIEIKSALYIYFRKRLQLTSHEGQQLLTDQKLRTWTSKNLPNHLQREAMLLNHLRKYPWRGHPPERAQNPLEREAYHHGQKVRCQ